MRGGYDKAPGVAIIDTLLLEARISTIFNFSFDLIADNIQALMELVKNSYDADASKICASIKTQDLTGADTGDIVPEAYLFGNETKSS
jgi:hypothetical protein